MFAFVLLTYPLLIKTTIVATNRTTILHLHNIDRQQLTTQRKKQTTPFLTAALVSKLVSNENGHVPFRPKKSLKQRKTTAKAVVFMAKIHEVDTILQESVMQQQPLMNTQLQKLMFFQSFCT